MSEIDQFKTTDRKGEPMLNSGSIGQFSQMGSIGVTNTKPPEDSALCTLTKRLSSQVVLAQSIENEIESVARRLGGSVPPGGSEAAREDSSGPMLPPRIDELNGLVDLLSKALFRTEAEVQRLRRMVD